VNENKKSKIKNQNCGFGLKAETVLYKKLFVQLLCYEELCYKERIFQTV